MPLNGKAFSMSPVQRYLERLHQDLLTIEEGEVASYIPELTTADPSWLGISLVTVDAHVYQVGDSRQEFTIQSISKAITYGLALEDRGLEQVLSKVGVEPSGEAFNSISLEPETGRPMNPMINAGAIATTGMVATQPDQPPMQRILDTFARYTGRKLEIDEKVYQSEASTGHRNRAISHLLYGHEILDRSPDEVVDLYFQQCSILVNARDLAMMAACLANNGVNPVTGVVALKSEFVDRVLSVMSTCGMYDYSGAWIFHVGMPAKSGVGGGIMAVLPGQFGLGVFSPKLDVKGNSVRGIEACKRLSSDYALHLFNVSRSTSASIVRNTWDCAQCPSQRKRSSRERELLQQQGGQIRIYELQGELLFGNTESVTLDMLSRLERIEYIVVNFKRVVAIDSAAAMLLGDLCERLKQQDTKIFLSHTQHLYSFRRLLQKTLGQEATAEHLRFDDTDHAVEWCENRVLHGIGSVAGQQGELGLHEQYLLAELSEQQLQELREIGIRREFASGTRIVRTGDTAESMFFIQQGEVDVLVHTDSGDTLRVTTLGAGTVFGEVTLVGSNLRTADIVAIDKVVCLEVRFETIGGSVRNQMLINLAGQLADIIKRDTLLLRHLG